MGATRTGCGGDPYGSIFPPEKVIEWPYKNFEKSCNYIKINIYQYVGEKKSVNKTLTFNYEKINTQKYRWLKLLDS